MTGSYNVELPFIKRYHPKDFLCMCVHVDADVNLFFKSMRAFRDVS